jgi:hypothetical protein
MSIFQQWLRNRNLKEGLANGADPVDGFKFGGNDEDYADDYENVQRELVKAIMSKYPDEAMEFFNGIAQRGDEEVAALLSKLQQDKPDQMRAPQHPTDGDEVVPSGADTGFGGEYGGDE